MKRRVLSLMLVAIMLICMIPAVSLVSYADESQSPAVGTYEYYEHMWYDDGHLQSFVDLTKMTSADFVMNSEALELEGTDYRIINGKTGITTTQGLRSFVKILDGTNAGKYYLITIDYRDSSGVNVLDNYTFTANSEGLAVIPARMNSSYVHGEQSGIWIAHAYTADEVVIPFERGYASASTVLDSAFEVGSTDALNSFSVEMVRDYKDSSINPPVAVLLACGGRGADARYGVSSSEESFKDSPNTRKKQTESYQVIGGYQLSGDTVPSLWLGFNGRYGGNIHPKSNGGNFANGDTIHVSYSLRYTSPTTYSLNQKALMKTGNWVSADANHERATVASEGYPSYGAYNDLSGLMVTFPDMVNMYYLRIYDCELTAEQLKQNHFADLCYYFGIDMTAYNALAKKFKNTVFEQAQQLSLSDPNAGAKLNAMVANVLANAMPEFGDASVDYATPVVDAELAKYINLYYDDGHLMSMMKLSDIEDSDIVYNGADAEINGARIVLGNTHETGGKYDSYVKILAGKYAGEYYRLGNQGADDKYTQKVEIDDEGFIKYNEENQFRQWGTRNVGVMFAATYSEDILNTVSPSGEKSKFIYSTEYLQYDNTYGNFTMEGVYRMSCPYYVVGNETKQVYAPLMAMGYHKGSFALMSAKNNTIIGNLYTGQTHGDGAMRETHGDFVVNETYHYIARLAYTTRTNLYRSLYMLHPSKGPLTTTSGKEPTFDLELVKNDLSQFTAHNQGTKMYLLRFYDVSLTPEQMKQNNFADLCYYYGLENTDALAALGSLVLNDTFYSAFNAYRVGMCTTSDVATMQANIDRAISRALDKEDVLALISANYSKALANAASAEQSVAVVKEILDGIDAYIAQVQGMTAVNDEAQALFDKCVEDLLDIKDNVNLYYLIVTNYKANSDAVKNLATEIKNSSSASVEIDRLLANSLKLEKKMHYSEASSLNNAQFATLAGEGSSEINRIVAVANSANAQILFDMDDYIRFAGYQIRVNDYAAMRALFAVDTEAISAGYTFGDLSYDIVSIGFMIAEADSADLSVNYDGARITTNAKGALIRYIDEWNRVESKDTEVSEITEMSDGKAYSITKAYDGADAAKLTEEYTKEYVVRIFAVIEGENTQFIRYSDVESVNVGNTVSLYELAKYASGVESADRLAEELFITRVITTVDGKKS
ncbi:MAG: hypothetical protein IKA74_03220 [Clostridia bacterium]|nr:hypothetical protein [Clostridia bacterium]